MKRVIGDYDSGQITLSAEELHTDIGVHWPFDRETDEWIDLSARFSKPKLRDAARGESQGAVLHESQGNLISLRSLDDGRFRLLIRGKNSLGAVEADLILSNQLGVQLLHALAEE